MKRVKALLISLLLIAPIACFNASALPSSQVVQMQAVNNGIDIFYPPAGSSYQHEYGPSIIINPDNSIDGWFSGPAGKIGWDTIQYRHSGDGGKTWSSLQTVLSPTAGSLDALSTCDPGVIKIGSYYYIGYTSTTNPNATQNNVYVARSTSPTGPYKKWTGSGWGKSPVPITNYNQDPSCYGCGEPSFVLMGSTIYMYYTWSGPNGSYTQLATAPVSDNWPADLTFNGNVLTRGAGEDSTDIKYCDQIGKFIGVSTAQRFQPDSYIRVYESDDGITFNHVCNIKDNIIPYCHNCGISGTQSCHIDLSERNFISYAYEILDSNGNPIWGSWPTRFAPLSIATSHLLNVYELENGSIVGANINTNHTGYTGTGFIDNWSAAGDSVTVTVNVPTAGSYPIYIRYGNGQSTSQTTSLYVNDQKIGQLSFPVIQSGNWDEWDDLSQTAPLNAGNNTIKLQLDSGDTGQFNLDNIQLYTTDAIYPPS